MWARYLNAALGVWLMAAPAVLGYGPPAEVNDRIVGPVAASIAVMSMWQVLRPLRWVNAALGLWLAASPLALGFGGRAALGSVLAGLALAGLACVRGPVTLRFGGGWRALLKSSS